MEQQKLSPTTVYVLSVLSLFCCCFWGFGSIFAGIAFYIAHSKIKLVQANPDDFEPCWPVLKKYFGNIRPAATMISAGLADEKMKIEIEATAMKKV